MTANNATSSYNGLKLGVVTAHSGCVQKRYYLDSEGVLQRDNTRLLNVNSGLFENRVVNGFEGLAETINHLTANQALTLGVSRKTQPQKLLTRDNWEAQGKQQGTIARTKECITWSKDAHFILLDHDAEPGKPGLSADEFWSRLTACVPELNGIGRLVTSSTSSGIYNSETGECLKGESGHHTFIAVKGDVETLKELLKVRLWAVNEAFFKLGKPNKQTGVASVLERFLLDITVFSSERLVYEAGAELGEGLIQKRSAPKIYPGAVLDIATLPKLTDAEKTLASDHRAIAESIIRGVQLESVTSWISETDNVDPIEATKRAKAAIKACDRGNLAPNHKLYFKSGEVVEAGKLNDTHIGQELRDPQEPDYDNSRIVAKVYESNGRYIINSFAHGQKVYRVSTFVPKDVWTEQNKTVNKAFKGLGSYADKIVQVSQKELEIPVPTPGTILFISSAVRTGKTTAITKIGRAHLKNDGYLRYFTYRNSLCAQAAEKLGIDHISHFKQNRDQINAAKAFAACPDSAHLNAVQALKPNTWSVIDEADATMKHNAYGETLGDKQEVKLIHWQNYHKKIIADGGCVILMEDSLTELTIDSYRKMIGWDVPYTILVNDYQLSNYPVIVGDGSLSGMVDHLVQSLANGGKPVLAYDSQIALESVDRMLDNAGATYTRVRVDSTTVDEADIKTFMSRPDGYVTAHKPQMVMYSPTAESGLSIWSEGFTAVYAYFTHSDTRQAIQMLERYRLDVPRYICCQGTALGSKKTKLKPSEVLAELKFKHDDNIERSKTVQRLIREAAMDGLTPDLSPAIAHLEMQRNDERTKLWNWVYASYKARENADKVNFLKNLIEELESRGHQVTYQKWESSKTIALEMKVAREEIKFDRAVVIATADGEKYTVDEAHKLMESHDLSKADQACCKKTILNDQLPGAPTDDPEYVHAVTDKHGALISKVLNAVHMFLPQLAHERDARYHTRKLNESPLELYHKGSKHSAKADFLHIAQPLIVSIVQMDGFNNQTPEVVQFNDMLVSNPEIVDLVWGLDMQKCHPAYTTADGKKVPAVTPASNVRKFLKKAIGLKATASRPGTTGNRPRVYTYQECPHWIETFKALTKKYEEAIAEIPMDAATSKVYKDISSLFKSLDVTENDQDSANTDSDNLTSYTVNESVNDLSLVSV